MSTHDGEQFVSWGQASSEASPKPPVLAFDAGGRRRLLPWITVAVVGAVVACVVLLTSGGSSSPPNGVASMQPAAILAATRTALGSASAYRMSGAGESGGQHLNVNLEIVAGLGAEGTASARGVNFDLTAVGGNVYLKGSAAAWQAVGGGAGAALFADKWLEVAANKEAFVSEFANSAALLAHLLPQKGTAVKGPITTVNGQQAVEVTEEPKGVVVYVATTGKPYPVEVVQPGSSGGTLVFDRFDQPVPISAPPNPINISQIDGSGS